MNREFEGNLDKKTVFTFKNVSLLVTALSFFAVIGINFLWQSHAWAASPVTEYPIYTPESEPTTIVTGPDGNLWFTGNSANNIDKITPSGVVTEYHLSGNQQPFGITVGPDGNLWFTNVAGNSIGKITLDGTITTYPVTTANAFPSNIVVGPNGNLWFAEAHGSASKIGEMTPSGVMVAEYPILTPPLHSFDVAVSGMAVGTDGNIWFAEPTVNKIGMVTPSGVMTEYTVPTSASQPDGMTAGPNGNLWFTEQDGNKIGEITTSGVISEFPITTADSGPVGITTGPDGNLWFTEQLAQKIGEMTPSGVMVAEYPLLTDFDDPGSITTGPDGNMWFTENGTDQIGKLVIPIAPKEVNQAFTLPVNTTKAVDVVTGIGGNPDPSTLTIITSPSHGSATLDTSTGVITEKPTTNYLGVDSLTYQICSLYDGSLCTQAKLTFTYITAASATKTSSTTTIKAPNTGFGTAPDPWTALYIASPIAFGLLLVAVITRRRFTQTYGIKNKIMIKR